jgi:hypothetical protein
VEQKMQSTAQRWLHKKAVALRSERSSSEDQ